VLVEVLAGRLLAVALLVALDSHPVQHVQEQHGASALKKSAPAATPTPPARYGREIHRTFDYGPGFRREFTLPSGRRPDAVNLRERVVAELKPNNPAAIPRGLRQHEVYKRELDEVYPGAPFETRLETYDRP
jgi:hypothetical protein